MISRVIIGYGDAAHTGSVGCEYAFLRVFKDDTLGRNDVKTISGFKKNIRRMFVRRSTELQSNY